jgi:uncharacterized damage-inducible protein DinB
MLFRQHPLTCVIAVLALFGIPAFAQTDIKGTVLKHLKTSREFTLKVADQMPEASYNFKLTPPQMSFAEQMVHLSQTLDFLLAPLAGDKPDPGKPASMNKKDVMAYMEKSFDRAIDRVSKITPEQITKTYQGGEGAMTGLEILMFTLDHTTHHRASAEMYLRARGITPTDYQF